MRWTYWEQEGNLCRAEGPDSSRPRGYRHPVTRMNVISRVGGGIATEFCPKQLFQVWI